MARPELCPDLFACADACVVELGIGLLRGVHVGDQDIEKPLLHPGGDGFLVQCGKLAPDHGHRAAHQVPDHRLDIAADIADLGVLRGLDLDERCVGEFGDTPCDLCLTHARGSDHDDVLGIDLLPYRIGESLAPCPVAQGHGDGPLGLLLADDILVQLRHDLCRGHVVQRKRFCGGVIHGHDGRGLRLHHVFCVLCHVRSPRR